MAAGLDHAGYLQNSNAVDAVLIGPSTGSTAATTCAYAQGWYRVEVISSGAVFAGITAPGLTGSSKITSGTTYLKNAAITCSKITSVKLSCDSTGHAVIAFTRTIL